MINTAKPSRKTFDPIPPLSLDIVSVDGGAVELQYKQREPDADLQLHIILTDNNDHKWVEVVYFESDLRAQGQYTHSYPNNVKDIRYTILSLGPMMKQCSRTVEF